MAARELFVLGTASQVPTRYRNHNAYFLRWDEEGFLFDPGEGTQRQMIFGGLSAPQITRIFITHFHGDHALGLAGMLQRLSLDRTPHPIHVYFPASGRVFFERLHHATIYHDVAEVVPHPIREEGLIVETEKFVVEARRLDHGVETYGYAVQERHGRKMLPEKLLQMGVRGPAIGELQRKGTVTVDGKVVTLESVSEERRGQRFGFVMDTRPCDGARQLARGADLLVAESTYLDAHAEEAHAHQHMTARQAATLAKEGGARRLILTHFSQRYPEEGPFLAEAGAIFPDVAAARDLDRYPLPPREAPRGGEDPPR